MTPATHGQVSAGEAEPGGWVARGQAGLGCYQEGSRAPWPQAHCPHTCWSPAQGSWGCPVRGTSWWAMTPGPWACEYTHSLQRQPPPPPRQASIWGLAELSHLAPQMRLRGATPCPAEALPLSPEPPGLRMQGMVWKESAVGRGCQGNPGQPLPKAPPGQRQHTPQGPGEEVAAGVVTRPREGLSDGLCWASSSRGGWSRAPGLVSLAVHPAEALGGRALARFPSSPLPMAPQRPT